MRISEIGKGKIINRMALEAHGLLEGNLKKPFRGLTGYESVWSSLLRVFEHGKFVLSRICLYGASGLMIVVNLAPFVPRGSPEDLTEIQEELKRWQCKPEITHDASS